MIKKEEIEPIIDEEGSVRTSTKKAKLSKDSKIIYNSVS